MYKIEQPHTIECIIVAFYGLRLWNRQETIPIGYNVIALQVFHIVYYMLCVVSIAVKAFTTDDTDESVFLTALAILATVHLFRLLYIIAKKSETIKLIDELGTHSTNESEEYIRIDGKLKRFMKHGNGFIVACLCEVSMIIIFPILSNGKAIINVAFPLSTSSRLVFWTQQVFVLFGALYSVVCVCIAVIVWYLLLNGAIKYEMLGTQLRNLGYPVKKDVTKELNISKERKSQKFHSDLIEAIQLHRQITE